MTAIEIRNVLIAEAGRLQVEPGSRAAEAGRALATFANIASPDELVRFRSIVINEPADFWDPTSPEAGAGVRAA